MKISSSIVVEFEGHEWALKNGIVRSADANRDRADARTTRSVLAILARLDRPIRTIRESDPSY